MQVQGMLMGMPPGVSDLSRADHKGYRDKQYELLLPIATQCRVAYLGSSVVVSCMDAFQENHEHGGTSMRRKYAVRTLTQPVCHSWRSLADFSQRSGTQGLGLHFPWWRGGGPEEGPKLNARLVP